MDSSDNDDNDDDELLAQLCVCVCVRAAARQSACVCVCGIPKLATNQKTVPKSQSLQVFSLLKSHRPSALCPDSLKIPTCNPLTPLIRPSAL